MVVGPALVDHALDNVAVSFLSPDDLAVERRLFGEAADGLDELRPEVVLSLFHIIR